MSFATADVHKILFPSHLLPLYSTRPPSVGTHRNIAVVLISALRLSEHDGKPFPSEAGSFGFLGGSCGKASGAIAFMRAISAHTFACSATPGITLAGTASAAGTGADVGIGSDVTDGACVRAGTGVVADGAVPGLDPDVRTGTGVVADGAVSGLDTDIATVKKPKMTTHLGCSRSAVFLVSMLVRLPAAP